MDCSVIFECLKEWQTLISALLALGAAAFTIRAMNNQLRSNDTRHAQAADRKKKAVRAQLPDALSELSSHIRCKVAQFLSEDDAHLEPPVAALTTLKNAIEFVDDDAAARLFELVSWYQVWGARIKGAKTKNPLDFKTTIYDSALLMAYVNSLFDYASNKDDVVSTNKPTQTDMITALKNSVGLSVYAATKQRYAEVESMIDRGHEQSCGN